MEISAIQSFTVLRGVPKVRLWLT